MLVYSATIVLVVSILGVNAWLPFQMMGHSHAHAQHDSTTHASPLCTLLCSAGQMGQIADAIPVFAQSYAYRLEPPIFKSCIRINASSLLARGPPVLFQSIVIL